MSALNSLKEIQQGFSLVKFSNLIDNVLLVEGKTDGFFYKRFTNSLSVFYGEPKTSESNEIEEIVLKKTDFNKNFYGILDADYKTREINTKIKDRIFIIDANSLETLLVKYAGTVYFEWLIKKRDIITDDNKEQVILKKTNKIKNNITESAIKWAFKIGCLRKKSENLNLGLSFKKVKECSSYYNDYISYSEENYKLKGEFNEDLFLANLCSKSAKFTGNVEQLKKYIEKFNSDLAWDICQGHDIFDFIDCLNRGPDKLETSQIQGNMFKKKQRSSSVPEWEYKIIEIYDIKKFDNSPLKKWFNTTLPK